MKKAGKLDKVPDIDIHEHLNYFFDAYDDDGNLVYGKKLYQKKKIYGGDWMAFYQESLANIAKMGLTGEQHDVFLSMLSKLDFENYIRISQVDLAKEWNIRQPQVARAIKTLLEKDIISQGPRAGLCKTYILNPNVGIKGRQKKKKLIDYAEKKAQREQEKRADAQKKAKKALSSEPKNDDETNTGK